MVSLIEQGMKVYTAIFKRIYRHLKEELGLLYNLNRLYLPEDSYVNILDDQQAISTEDYEDKSFDVRPAADPTMATDIQKAGKAQFLQQFMADPRMNFPEIQKEVFSAMGIEDSEKYLAPPPTGPAPEEQLAMQKEAAEMEMRDREIRIKEAELGIKRDESNAKQFDLYASALKKAAETDELGGDNLLNTQELTLIKQSQEKANVNTPTNVPPGVPNLEGSQ